MANVGKYHKRFYKVDSGIPINISLNHFSRLNELTLMIKWIGEDVYNDIEENSSVGVILKLASAKYKWTGRPVQQLLIHKLNIAKKYEMWMLVGSRPIRFSLHEFEEITTLNCRLPDEVDAGRQLVIAGLWEDMEVVHGSGPTLGELKKVLARCREWTYEKRKAVGLLMILYLHPKARVPVFAAKMVMDLERFERYPWGRVAFEQLITNLDAAHVRNESYTVHGLVHAALIWVYEYVPGVGELLGERRGGDIPLLRWASTNKRGIALEDIIAMDEEKTEDHKVTFKAMFVR